MVRIIYILLFIFLSNITWGQRLDPITKDLLRKRLPQHKNIFTERLHLPFFDDFSPLNTFPDTLLWKKNGGVFINDNFGWRPPSFGVATFDGLDASGNPYSNFSPSAIGKTDELVSHKIDLSLQPTNVYLSFYYQPSGLGFVQPNPGDSLKLFLLDSNFSWNQVWSEYIDSVQEFKFKFIPILDLKYLHRDFQFKFESYGNKSGMYDVWNIDYVYLDKNRDTTSFFKDIAISKGPNSYLKNYTAMPYNQFLANTSNTIADSIAITINDFKNNGGLPIPFNKKCVITNLNSNDFYSIFDDGAIINNLEKQFLISSSNANLDLFSTNTNAMRLESKFEINTNDPEKGDTIFPVIPDSVETNKGKKALGVGDEIIYNQQYYLIEAGLNLTLQAGDSFYFQNDTLQIITTISLNPIGVLDKITTNHNNTIRRVTSLEDYFAYDDGTAEKTFVMSQKFGFVAYRFDLNVADTLIGIEYVAPITTKSADGESIELVVWQDLDYPIGVGDSVLHSEPIAIYHSDTLNKYQTVRYSIEIPVSGHFYVGWLVTGDEEVHFGYDVNNSANGKIWVKKEEAWSLFEDEGALMIRPIMGKERFTNVYENYTSTFVKLFPNPTNGVLNIEGNYNEINVFNQIGTLVYSAFNEKQLNLETLNNGMYFVQIRFNNQVQFEKIILTK